MARVLIVEDDPDIRIALCRAMSDRGHAVCSAATGMTGLQEVVTAAPDLVVLDLGLPDVDGEEILKMVRAVSRVPVVIETARDDEAEIIRLLDAGADDYVVKPFSAEQLDARIRAVMRRAGHEDGPSRVRVGELEVDAGAREASLAGIPLDLTAKEFDLLAYLTSRSGQVVTKRELLTEVWRQPYGGGDKTVDVHLSWLRRKLGETAQQPRYLRTIRGAGVKLLAP